MSDTPEDNKGTPTILTDPQSDADRVRYIARQRLWGMPPLNRNSRSD